MADHDHEPLQDLIRLLTHSLGSEDEARRIAGVVGTADDRAAVDDLLCARVPQRAAWMAPQDGYVHVIDGGLLHTAEPVPGTGYSTGAYKLVAGGGRMCESRDKQLGWIYGPLDGRRLLVASGDAVKSGDLLTDGPYDLGDLLMAAGLDAAVSAAATRLTELCELDSPDAVEVVRPLFDAVRVIKLREGDEPLSGLDQGMLCTRRYFFSEQGRAIGHALRNLPPAADTRLRAAAGIADDVGRFELFMGQSLYEVADAAGLTIRLAVGRPTYLGVASAIRLAENGGAVTPTAMPTEATTATATP
ncbi:hypothetical protein KDK95_04240 [Actinospica sp. MGRD01-02]|uniref:Uncharacterized protein n=1 Tax=Actinospica acidithermotolerans TaxID=2828514 RepID=A0A941E7S0_9ACTN|nr:hypothetical protein [Actinospica acidithermotolerans]MBR7825503.1 hypothetical protein [Actinospica acidithermotolerans]